MDKRCEKYQAVIPLFLAGQLDTGRREDLEAHAQSCIACEADLAELQLAFSHLSDRLVKHDSAFAVLSRLRPVETGPAGIRGQVIPFPTAGRPSIRSRKFRYWAFRVAAMGIFVLTAFASIEQDRSGNVQGEEQVQVATRVVLPMPPDDVEPAIEYEIPSAYGLGIPLPTRPEFTPPRHEVPAGYGLARFAYLAPLYEPPPSYGVF